MAGVQTEISSDKLSIRIQNSAAQGFGIQRLQDLTQSPIKERELTLYAPFSVTIRKPGDESSIVTVDPSTADRITAPVKSYIASDPLDSLGARWRVTRTVFWDDPFGDGGLGDDLEAVWTMDILDSQPDRVRFKVQAYFIAATSNGCVYFIRPLILSLPDIGGLSYLNAHNGGILTQAPKTDLVGVTGYQFNTAVKYAPETYTAVADNTFEVLYPTHMSIAASAFGSCKSGEAFLVHDDLTFRARRFLDSWDGTTRYRLQSEQLQEDCLVAYNNATARSVDPAAGWPSAVTYLSYFHMKGEVVGEDMGLQWRKWFLSSVEGQAILAAKPKDRLTDMPISTQYPLMVQVGKEDIDDGDANDTTRKVYDELRTAFPVASYPEFTALPRYAPTKLLGYADDATTGYPATVDDVIPDGWDFNHDAAKATFTKDLRDNKAVRTLANVSENMPTPYDGANDMVSGTYLTKTGSRVVNHLDAEDAGYKTVAGWIKVVDTLASNSTFDGTYTVITLTADLDDDLWDRYTTSNDAGHAAHPDHLGWVDNTTTATQYVMERVNETAFKTGKQIRVAGDVTANFLSGNSVSLYFQEEGFLPGYSTDGTLANNKGTMFCPWADAFSSGTKTDDAGHLSRMYERLKLFYGPEGAGNYEAAGYVSTGTRKAAVCFQDNHTVDGFAYNHTPGDNAVILGMRNARNYLRSVMTATATNEEWQFYDEYGPYDWLIGESDGFIRTSRRQDLATGNGSWAASPFFVTALGDYLRMGWYEGNENGHATTSLGESAWVTVMEGALGEQAREGMVWDWMNRKLLSMSFKMDSSSKMGTGTLPDRSDAYTPFYHSSAGMEVNGTFARLMALLINVQNCWSFSNFTGARLRSLRRLSRSTIAARATSYPEGHDIPIQEIPSVRNRHQHQVFQVSSDPRKIVAVIVNDSTNDYNDSYQFVKDWYKDYVPGGAGTYTLTKYTFRHDGWDTEDLGIHYGDYSWVETMESSTVVAYEFHFNSGLRFTYSYDQDATQELPIPASGARVRVEDIHGHGERFKFGFKSDLPDESVTISSVSLRLRGLGRSEQT